MWMNQINCIKLHWPLLDHPRLYHIFYFITLFSWHYNDSFVFVFLFVFGVDVLFLLSHSLHFQKVFSKQKKKKKFLSLWVEETHSPTPAPHYISNLFLPVLEEILLLLLTPPPQVLIMDDFSAAPFQLPVDIKMALSLVLWICINSEINSNVLLTKNIQTFEVFYIFLNIESWEKNNF